MSALGQFNNIRTIRKEAHEMGHESFLEFAEKVLIVKGEIEEAQQEEIAKQALVEEKLKATTELLQSEGFDVSFEAVRALLLGQIDAPTPTGKGKGGKGVKRGSVEPKYAFTVEGEEQTWTGRGRMPLALKELIEKGEELESFLIKKED
ncbi:H-NS histone family protein [Salmonella enterica subsp. enterica serovar Infantis]|nr:H-NS histone family protein [Salmonella enterica subsp. enterica serovar Infantis]EMB9503522.1 H-NS histone family protein [Salmonella enterica subsp. enterica serovar Infantis]EMC5846721.1 H-NS histone family protein [Salmonella enterica subsp. enterica serovar Infantis]EMC9315622.1 H-NS histone family protein [Salmonella enterica subsp. enterica serovar Infantis]